MVVWRVHEDYLGLITPTGELHTWEQLKGCFYLVPQDQFNGCGGYLRVSTGRQVEEGYSLATQARLIGEAARENGRPVTALYIDPGKSAYRLPLEKRQGAARLMHDIEANVINQLWLYTRNRMCRRAEDGFKFVNAVKEHRVAVLFASKGQSRLKTGATSIFEEGIIWIQNEWESAQKSVLLTEHVMNRYNARRWYTAAPYGYQTRNAGILQLHPEEAPIVKEIFRILLEEGLGAASVAKVLNQKGLRTDTGSPWMQRHILRIAKRRVYAGWICPDIRDRELCSEPLVPVRSEYIPPFVTDEQYEAIQVMFERRGHNQGAKNKRFDGRYQDSPYLLTSLLSCGECGHQMRGHVKPRDRKRGVDMVEQGKVYMCRNSVALSCRAWTINAALLEETVIQGCHDYLTEVSAAQRQAALAEKDGAHVASLEERVRPLQAQVDDLEGKMSGLYEALSAFKDPEAKEGCVARITSYDQQARQVKSQISSLTAELEIVQRREEFVQKQCQQLNDWPTQFGQATKAGKRVLLRQLVKSIKFLPREARVEITFWITPRLVEPGDTVSVLVGGREDETQTRTVRLDGYLGPDFRLPPFGYMQRGCCAVPDPHQAEVVRKVFTILADHSLDDTVSILNEMGLLAPGRGPWSVSKVRRVVYNPIYCGFFKTGRRDKRCSLDDCEPYPLPALVDTTLWLRVQETSKSRMLWRQTEAPPVTR